jgi:hypothetical protein
MTGIDDERPQLAWRQLHSPKNDNYISPSASVR